MTAQVVTITETLNSKLLGGLQKVSWDWLCTDAGVVASSVTTNEYTGIIVSMEMIPDPETTTPTAAYTATVSRSDGADVLHGLGVGSATATDTVSKVFSDGLGAVIQSKLTLAIAAAGNAKGGILNLYIMPA